jgi:hypothetical protein
MHHNECLMAISRGLTVIASRLSAPVRGQVDFLASPEGVAGDRSIREVIDYGCKRPTGQHRGLAHDNHSCALVTLRLVIGAPRRGIGGNVRCAPLGARKADLTLTNVQLDGRNAQLGRAPIQLLDFVRQLINVPVVDVSRLAHWISLVMPSYRQRAPKL